MTSELQQRTEAAEREVRQRQALDAIEASGSRITNARAFARVYSDAFEFDESGKLTNLQAIVARGKSETPEFFGGRGAGSIDAGAGLSNNPPPGQVDMNALIRRGR